MSPPQHSSPSLHGFWVPESQGQPSWPLQSLESQVDMQVPGLPGSVISAAQQTRPSSQLPSSPVVQGQFSLVQGQSLEHVPVPPG